MPSTLTDRLAGLSTSVAVKAPVRVATTANITLSGTQTIDGIAVVADDRVLVKNQTSSSENGIYYVASGTWARAEDLDSGDDIVNATTVFVREGTVNGSNWFQATLASYPAVIGTTAITWAKVYVSLTSVGQATESLIGIAEIATQAETDAGTDDQRIITPSKLANSSLASQVTSNTANLKQAKLLSNCQINVSVASNAMTIAVKTQAGTDPTTSDPVKIAFRSSTESSGGYVIRSITSALSMTVSAGSTLGFANSETNVIHIGFIDNAGTVELVVSKELALFTEGRVVSTTAEGGAGGADSGTVLYSTTARSNVACRLAAVAKIQTGATAGNWTAAPTRISEITDNAWASLKNTCKAWLMFDATTNTILDSFNVASVTKNATGDITVNFLVSLADINYAPVPTIGGTASVIGVTISTAALPSTSACRLLGFNTSFAGANAVRMGLIVVGNL